MASFIYPNNGIVVSRGVNLIQKSNMKHTITLLGLDLS